MQSQTFRSVSYFYMTLQKHKSNHSYTSKIIVIFIDWFICLFAGFPPTCSVRGGGLRRDYKSQWQENYILSSLPEADHVEFRKKMYTMAI